MAATENLLNAMLDFAAGNKLLYVSLHDADPSTSGANELSGGAYARVAVTWNSASGGALDSSNQPLVNVPAGATVAYVGLWDAASGGNFQDAKQVTSEVYSAAGTYLVEDLDYTLASA